MPELPEVETVVRGLQRTIQGEVIQKVQIFRERTLPIQEIDEFQEQLAGKTIMEVARRGKYILFHLTPPLLLIAHLRMTGKFIVADIDQPAKHHRAWFTLQSGMQLIFDDMRCFGTLELYPSLEQCRKLQEQGIEPLSKELTVENISKLFGKSTKEIKNLLLNQSKIVGIGNIYASEILFASGISPFRQGQSISREEIQKLQKETQRILHIAITKNGTSISDFRKVDDKTGEFQNFLQVYGKHGQPCPTCGTPIQRAVQQQRSSFYCSVCQN